MQTAILLTDEIADGPLCIPISHHARRAAVNTQLVFDRNTLHIVTLAKTAVAINEKLGNDKQRDAFDPLGRIRRASQH